MGRLSLAVVTAVVIAVAVALPAAATNLASTPTFRGPFRPEGGFEVRALVDGVWQHVGDLSFDRFVRERTILLPPGASGVSGVRVRLVQHGGGAAHIDEIRLGDTPPSRVAGAADSDAVALVTRRDNDLVDTFGRTLDVSFPASQSSGVLRVWARVEGPVVEGRPFAFPRDDTFRPVTLASSFYTYVPATRTVPPSWPEGLDPAKALFAERCTPTTGHPDGVTYGWVANDRTHLYAAVEFTPDNTRDGDKDWSAVWVKRGDELREFRVSEADTRWGRPSFEATKRAVYRHKLYTFAIPFSALGVRTAREAGPLELAFNAYGTAAISILSPLFWDFGSIVVGATSPTTTFTITNPDPTFDMVLGSPWFTRNGPNSGDFPLTPGGCSDNQTLAHGGGSCSFQVAFGPTATGFRQDGIVVHATIGAGPEITATATVQGQGLEPIPVLGYVGLAMLAFLLAAAGFFLLRRG
jgi:hypothetical protein